MSKFGQYIIVLFIVSICTSLKAQSSLVSSITSIVNDTTYITKFKYNNHNQLSSKEIFIDINDNLSKIKYSTYQYNNNIVSEQHDYILTQSTWKEIYSKISKIANNKPLTTTITIIGDSNTIKETTTYLYNINGANTSENRITTIDNETQSTTLITYQYDNNKLSTITQNISIPNSTSIQIDTEIKDSINYTTTITKQYIENRWDTIHKNIVKSDINGEPLYETDYRYINTKWIPIKRSIYTYDINGNLINKLYQSWQIQFWQNILITKYEYNENNDITQETIYTTKNNEIQPQYIHTTNYDEDNQISNIYAEQTFWTQYERDYHTFLPLTNNLCNEFHYSKSIEFTYQKGIIDNTTTETYNSVTIYPNPSPDGKYYIISHNETSILSYYIFNLDGRLLEHNTSQTSNIDITSYPSGIYLIQIETQQGFTTKKLIKTK